MAWAARNGFYYLLDRNNGQFLLAKNFVRQTWAKGFDDKGRPEVIPGNDPTPEGNDKVFPGVDGGANWMSHSYSPLTKLLYVFARDERRVFTKNDRSGTPSDEAAPSRRRRSRRTRRLPVAPARQRDFRRGGNLPAGRAAAAAESVSRPRRAGARWSRSIRCRATSSGNTRCSRRHGAA